MSISQDRFCPVKIQTYLHVSRIKVTVEAQFSEMVITFGKGKWEIELDYKLKKTYWAHTDNRIAVRFEYEWRNAAGQWYRAAGNENWEFDENGLMQKRFASINDLPIEASERRL